MNPNERRLQVDVNAARYLDALEREDFAAMAAIWRTAQEDPELLVALQEIHAGLIEEKASVSAAAAEFFAGLGPKSLCSNVDRGKILGTYVAPVPLELPPGSHSRSNMSVQTVCPNCETNYTLSDDKSGKKIRCKNCQEPFTVTSNAKANGKVNGKMNGAVNGKPGAAVADIVEIACPECETTMKIRSESLGKRVKCKKCEEIFTAKVAEEEEDATDEAEEDTKTSRNGMTAKAPSPKPAGKRKSDDEDEDEDDDKKGKKDAKDEDDDDDDGKGKKKKKKKKKKNKGGMMPVMLIAGGGGVALVLIAVVVVVIIMMSGGGDDPPPPIAQNKDKKEEKKKETPVNPVENPIDDKKGDDKVVEVDKGALYPIPNDLVPKKTAEIKLDVSSQVATIRLAAEWFKNLKNDPDQGQCIVIHPVARNDNTKKLFKDQPWLQVKGDWYNKELKKKVKEPAIYIEHHKRRDVTLALEKVIDDPTFENFDECWHAWTKWATVADLQALAVHLTRAPKSDYRKLIMETLARIKTEESAHVLAVCLSAVDPYDNRHPWAGQEREEAVGHLRQMGGEVSVRPVFNYIYHHDLVIRKHAYGLLYGYAIHWDNPDPFIKVKPPEIPFRPEDKPWVELHFYHKDGVPRAMLQRKDGKTTLSKPGDQIHGAFEFTAERDKDEVGLKNEKIVVKFENGEVLTGKFGKDAELDCEYSIPPSERNKEKTSLKFKLSRQGIPSTEAPLKTITWMPPEPWPLKKLPLDKTNWLLEKTLDHSRGPYPTVVDLPRLPVPKGEINYANAAAILKGPEDPMAKRDRLEELAAIDFLQKNLLNVKHWSEVAKELDPKIDPGKGSFKDDQFMRTNALIALERWSHKDNIASLLAGLMNPLEDLTKTRTEYGQFKPLPTDHEQMVQDYVKIPDKDASGKLLAENFDKLYPEHRKMFQKFFETNPSLPAQRANLKLFNHKVKDIRDMARDAIRKTQLNTGKVLTDDEVAEQCIADVGGDKDVTLNALEYMKRPTTPVHSDRKTKADFLDKLKTIIMDDQKENAQVRALAIDVQKRYISGK